jgi:putative transposase
MSRKISVSTGRSYGLFRVCRVWGLARSGVYWQRQRLDDFLPRRKPGPVGPCPDAELVEHIKGVLTDASFHGEGYRKVWARLRLAGIRTSKRRVLRLMREHGLLAPHRVGRPHGPKAHDGSITTERVDEMWGTDKTDAFTLQEGQTSIFLAVDHCNGECVGIHAAKVGTRFEALEPIRTVEELRLALLEFKERYNNQWLIERHGYKTPAQVRAEQTALLERAA